MAVVTGLVISKLGRYRWSIWTGSVFATLGVGLTSLLDVKTTIAQMVFINLVPGIGLEDAEENEEGEVVGEGRRVYGEDLRPFDRVKAWD